MVSESQIQVQKTAAKFGKLQSDGTAKGFGVAYEPGSVLELHVVFTSRGACAQLRIRILY
jgi:hypothetical protein